MKTLYIECNMGVAGDMLMGALYELCDQKEKFLSDMNQAFAPYGVTLSVELLQSKMLTRWFYFYLT